MKHETPTLQEHEDGDCGWNCQYCTCDSGECTDAECAYCIETHSIHPTQVAYHEAAHAVMARLFGFDVDDMKVCSRWTPDGQGYITYSSRHRANGKPEPTREQYNLIDAAGVAATAIVRGLSVEHAFHVDGADKDFVSFAIRREQDRRCRISGNWKAWLRTCERAIDLLVANWGAVSAVAEVLLKNLDEETWAWTLEMRPLFEAVAS